MEEAQGAVERGTGWGRASFAGSKGGAGSRPLLRRGSRCVGFSFSLRDVLVIHDSESLSRPTTSCGSILSMGAAKCGMAPARRDGYSDGGYELRRTPLP